MISFVFILFRFKTNKFSLCDQFESLPEFSTIEDLCLFYMKNDLPGEPVSVSRLMLPYRRLWFRNKNFFLKCFFDLSDTDVTQ